MQQSQVNNKSIVDNINTMDGNIYWNDIFAELCHCENLIDLYIYGKSPLIIQFITSNNSSKQ